MLDGQIIGWIHEEVAEKRGGWKIRRADFLCSGWSINIDKEAKLEADDIEMLEDMLTVAINNTFKQVDDYREQKMSKFGNIPGLF